MRARFRAAIKAAWIHLAVSIVLVASVSGIIYFLWFQGPYLDLFDGLHIVLIAVLVDVACGPLATAVVFNPAKSRRELVFDLSLVVAIQLVALAYGIYIASTSKPVALVFEVDRFVAVAAGQVDKKVWEANQEVECKQSLFANPCLLGVRDPKDSMEMLKSIERSSSGEEPSVRPDWWQPYLLSKSRVKQRMKKLSDLQSHLSETDQSKLARAMSLISSSQVQLYFLPLTSQKKLNDWVVLLDEEADLVGFAPVPGWAD